ncbi:hypothetical protein D3C72_1874840 [compost metagenome]
MVGDHITVGLAFIQQALRGRDAAIPTGQIGGVWQALIAMQQHIEAAFGHQVPDTGIVIEQLFRMHQEGNAFNNVGVGTTRFERSGRPSVKQVCMPPE